MREDPTTALEEYEKAANANPAEEPLGNQCGMEAKLIGVSGLEGRWGVDPEDPGGLLAGILNKRVVTLATQEGSAYGAALLAMTGTGAYATVAEACRAAIRETDSVTARAADAAFYGKAHRVYQSLYPALKPVCAAIGEL